MRYMSMALTLNHMYTSNDVTTFTLCIMALYTKSVYLTLNTNSRRNIWVYNVQLQTHRIRQVEAA